MTNAEKQIKKLRRGWKSPPDWLRCLIETDDGFRLSVDIGYDREFCSRKTCFDEIESWDDLLCLARRGAKPRYGYRIVFIESFAHSV